MPGGTLTSDPELDALLGRADAALSAPTAPAPTAPDPELDSLLAQADGALASRRGEDAAIDDLSRTLASSQPTQADLVRDPALGTRIRRAEPMPAGPVTLLRPGEVDLGAAADQARSGPIRRAESVTVPGRGPGAIETVARLPQRFAQGVVGGTYGAIAEPVAAAQHFGATAIGAREGADVLARGRAEAEQSMMEAGITAPPMPTDLTNPQWWAAQLGQAAGSAAGMSAAAVFAPEAKAAASVAAVTEALTEAGSVYNDLVARGMSPGEAMGRASGTFAANVALLGATDLPIFQQGGNILRRVLQTAAIEGGQEVGQQAISNTAEGRDLGEGMLESGIVGTAAGAMFGARGHGIARQALPAPETLPTLPGESPANYQRRNRANFTVANAVLEAAARRGSPLARAQAAPPAAGAPGAESGTVPPAPPAAPPRSLAGVPHNDLMGMAQSADPAIRRQATEEFNRRQLPPPPAPDSRREAITREMGGAVTDEQIDQLIAAADRALARGQAPTRTVPDVVPMSGPPVGQQTHARDNTPSPGEARVTAEPTDTRTWLERVAEDAVANGYEGTAQDAAAEIRSRARSLFRDQTQAVADSDDRALLEAIRDAGGIRITDDGETTAIREHTGGFNRIAGVQNVYRKPSTINETQRQYAQQRGWKVPPQPVTADEMATHLNSLPAFAHRALDEHTLRDTILRAAENYREGRGQRDEFDVQHFGTGAGIREGRRWWREGEPVRRSEHLSPAEDAIQETFARQIEDDLEGTVARYRERFGTVIDADKVKELAGVNVGEHHRALHQPSAWFARYLYDRTISEAEPGGLVVLTAGGPGAGKSSVVEKHPYLNQVAAAATLRYDSTLSNPEDARQMLDQAEAAGHTPVVVYVYTDPVEAYRRQAGRDRTVDTAYHIRKHREALQSAQMLAERLGDHLIVVDNSGPEAVLEDGSPVDILRRIAQNYPSDTAIRAQLEALPPAGGAAGGQAAAPSESPDTAGNPPPGGTVPRGPESGLPQGRGESGRPTGEVAPTPPKKKRGSPIKAAQPGEPAAPAGPIELRPHQKLKGVKGEIDIPDHMGDPLPVRLPATKYFDGIFAIHAPSRLVGGKWERSGPGFVITHVPTGQRFANVPNQAVARDAIELLARMTTAADWDYTDKSKMFAAMSPGLRARVFAIGMAVREGRIGDELRAPIEQPAQPKPKEKKPRQKKPIAPEQAARVGQAEDQGALDEELNRGFDEDTPKPGSPIKAAEPVAPTPAREFTRGDRVTYPGSGPGTVLTTGPFGIRVKFDDASKNTANGYVDVLADWLKHEQAEAAAPTPARKVPRSLVEQHQSQAANVRAYERKIAELASDPANARKIEALQAQVRNLRASLAANVERAREDFGDVAAAELEAMIPAAKTSDTLDTGEVQDRLPGDVGAVRDQNVKTAEFDAPFTLQGEVDKEARAKKEQEEKDKQDRMFLPAQSGDPSPARRAYDAPPNPPADITPPRSPVSEAQVVSELARIFGHQQQGSSLIRRVMPIPVKAGTHGLPAYGFFDTKQQVIRLRKFGDLGTFSHELGHDIDFRVFAGNRPQGLYKQELTRLGLRTSPKSASQEYVLGEGVAEFFRFWFANPEVAKLEAPQFYAGFMDVLKDNPPLAKQFTSARIVVQKYLAQDFETRGRARVDFSTIDPNDDGTSLVETMESLWIDDLATLKRAEEHLATEQPIDLPQSAYALATVAKGASMRASGFLNHGIRNDAGQFVGGSFKAAIAPVRDRLPDFSLYLVARRAQELRGRNIEPGMKPEEYKAILAKYESPEFDKAARDLYAFQRGIIDRGVEAGVVTAGQARAMAMLNQNYVPFWRILNDRSGNAASARRKNPRAPIHRIKGSGRDIVDPLQAIIRNTHAFVEYVEQAKARHAFIEQAMSTTGGGLYLEKVPTPQVATKFNLDQVRDAIGEALEDAGLDVEKAFDARKGKPVLVVGEGDEGKAVDLDELVTVFTNATTAKGGDRTITDVHDGQITFYNVTDPGLYEALTAIGPKGTSQAMRWFFKLAAPPARALRAGATLTLGFLARNPPRDTWTAMIQSDYGFTPVDSLKGLYSFLKQDEFYDQFVNSGAGTAAMVSKDRKVIERELRKLKEAGTLRDHLKDVAMHPIDALRALSEASEAMTRLGEFRNVLEQRGVTRALLKAGDEARQRERDLYRTLISAGNSASNALINRYMAARQQADDLAAKTRSPLLEAALASRKSTVDFSRKGSLGGEVNQVAAFFNAKVQGYARLYETFRAHPVKASIRVALGMTLPTLLLWALNHDDDEYQELPEWQKNAYWHIPLKRVGKKIDGTGWLKIPKPFEYGYLFGTVFEKAMDQISERDPHAWKRLFVDDPSVDAKDIPTAAALEAARNGFASIMPTAVIPLIEAATNYDFFREKPIVSPFDTDLPPELQYNRWTSETAKVIGRGLGVSPAMIDHMINGYGAGLARGLVEGGADKVIGAIRGTSEPPAPSTPIDRLPGIGAFTKRYAGSDAESIAEFYRRRDLLRSVTGTVNRYKAEGRPGKAEAYAGKFPDLERERRTFNRASDDLKDVRDLVSMVYAHRTLEPWEKRELLDRFDERMVNIARGALGRPALPSRFDKAVDPELLRRLRTREGTRLAGQ